MSAGISADNMAGHVILNRTEIFTITCLNNVHVMRIFLSLNLALITYSLVS